MRLDKILVMRLRSVWLEHQKGSIGAQGVWASFCSSPLFSETLGFPLQVCQGVPSRLSPKVWYLTMSSWTLLHEMLSSTSLL